jgi:hypothetical protein
LIRIGIAPSVGITTNRRIIEFNGRDLSGMQVTRLGETYPSGEMVATVTTDGLDLNDVNVAQHITMVYRYDTMNLLIFDFNQRLRQAWGPLFVSAGP